MVGFQGHDKCPFICNKKPPVLRGGKVFIMEKRSGREIIKRIGYTVIMPCTIYIKHINIIYLHCLTFRIECGILNEDVEMK